jgi:hypothetical protein
MAEQLFRKLNTQPLADSLALLPYHRRRDRSVDTDSPAVTVMTDLSMSRLVTVRTDAGLDEAQELMRLAGVRMLMVVDDRGHIVGLATSRDLTGEKPIHFASEQRVTRDEIRIADIMTTKGRMEVLQFADVERARVGDIVQTLRESSRAVLDHPDRSPAWHRDRAKRRGAELRRARDGAEPDGPGNGLKSRLRIRVPIDPGEVADRRVICRMNAIVQVFLFNKMNFKVYYILSNGFRRPIR